MAISRVPALLVLENGSVYRGYSFGFEKDGMGEVCFNTSMTGYQEILTDPSYKSQIVTLTYPMIGNYGIQSDYNQSSGIQAAGLVVKEYVDRPSNFVSEISLGEFLIQNKIPAIQRIDTRKLVLEIRREGAMRGGIFVGRDYKPSMLEEIRAQPSMAGLDLATSVTTDHIYAFGSHHGKKYRVAVFDFGVKRNILRHLDESGFAVDVLPAKTTVDEVKKRNYDCYFLSNGPGDPDALDYAIDTIRYLMVENKPIFGICLGHQLIGLASGRKTYKLKFGHRGGNQPVKVYSTGRVEITAQNHGFSVEEEGASSVRVSHLNLNDRTIEGFEDPSHNIISVQHHPEAAPGPNDSVHMFRDFYDLVERFYQR